MLLSWDMGANSTEVRDVHEANTLVPMVVTVEGMVIDLRDEA